MINRFLLAVGGGIDRHFGIEIDDGLGGGVIDLHSVADAEDVVGWFVDRVKCPRYQKIRTIIGSGGSR